MIFDLVDELLNSEVFLLLSQLHVTVLVLWSQCRAPPPSRVSPFLLWAWRPRWSNKVPFPICFVDPCPPTGLAVLDNWVFGFGWIRWVSLLLPATSESNSFIQLSFKEIFGGGRGDTYTFLFWLLQIPSQQISGYNRLGVYCKGWLHYILFDRTSILFVEQAVYRPNTPYPGVFSISACTMQDVVWSNQALADLCDPCSWDSQPWRIPSVFPCLNFVLPVSILNFWWSVNWPHIQYYKCTQRNCSESIHCPVVKDQWDCVLNDLEELERIEFLVLTGQYSIEIFYCCLRLLPSCSSIHHQTNIESTQIMFWRSSFSLQNSILHLLLEVILRIEEECSFFFATG